MVTKSGPEKAKSNAQPLLKGGPHVVGGGKRACLSRGMWIGAIITMEQE